MAQKGFVRHRKRLTIKQVVGLQRKKAKWIFSTIAGTHKKKDSLPLGVVLRDVLKVAETAREVKYLLKSKQVKVDGRVIKDARFPLGFQDLLELGEKKFRLVYDAHMRLALKEEKENGLEKLVKLKKKQLVKKGKMQLTLSDGRNILLDASEAKKYALGDTLKIALPKAKILEHYPLEPGKKAYIFSSKLLEGKILEILPGTSTRKSLVKMEDPRGRKFETEKEKLFVIK
jgi:small subunit ribosomal protein S4e